MMFTQPSVIYTIETSPAVWILLILINLYKVLAMEEISQYQQQIDQFIELAIQYTTQYGGKVILAILTLIIGMWIIGKVASGFEKALVAAKVEKSLAIFLAAIPRVDG